MDRTGLDALAERLVFLEDARQDMLEVKVPVTWIHGRHDAWMDVERVRELLSSGDTSQRRLLEVPTGHQLRSSREAMETFQLVAREVGRMTLGREIEAALPNLEALERRRVAERERLHRPVVNLRRFWRDYLLGRSSTYGIQLLTATDPYRRLMQRQIQLLGLRENQRIADLGSGVGDFIVQLSESHRIGKGVTVHGFDFVSDGLRRAEKRSTRGRANQRGVRSRLVLADLEGTIPVATGSYDSVLASLLIGYLVQPQKVLEEIHRILRPGGRLVLSTLKRDADISRIHVEGLKELRQGRAGEALGSAAALQIDELARDFLNDASRILDLEEQGRFKFWDAEEIATAIRKAGFCNVKSELAFGDPPQAVVVVADASG
jgi:ubiquinone/menaquinone biosynthesis C-methylase UbiE